MDIKKRVFLTDRHSVTDASFFIRTAFRVLAMPLHGRTQGEGEGGGSMGSPPPPPQNEVTSF